MLTLDYLANYPEFIQPIAELGLQEFGYLNPGQTVDDRIHNLQTHLQIDKLPIALVAFKNQEFIGTACLREMDLDTYAHVSPWLGSVMIASNYRNQGMGTWLVTKTMKKACALGITTWYLLYTPNQESFYAKMGWKTIDTTVYHGVSGVIMSLRV